jgi:hypothetical protein
MTGRPQIENIAVGSANGLITTVMAKRGTGGLASVSQSMEQTMFKSIPPYGIWSIWPELSLLSKAFFVGLCSLGLYSVLSALNAARRIRISTATPEKQDIETVPTALAVLRRKAERLHQTVGAAFYLFGFLLFLGLQDAYKTTVNSATPVGWLILENFMIHFAFAANVFFVLLLLHVAQWRLFLWVDAYGSPRVS